jgi:hypothetical protein
VNLNPIRRLLSIVLLVALAACAGGGSGDPADPGGTGSALEIQPPTAEVAPGDAVRFAATLDGLPGAAPVVWAVAEPEGGVVDATGHYIAPDVEGTFHVVATIEDTNVEAVAAVVQVKRKQPSGQAVAVGISPAAASIAAGESAVFTATVTGTASTGVTWSIEESAAGGTLASGAYTAPQTAGTYHVVARSVADPTQSAVATVTVTPPPVDPSIVDVTTFGAKGDGVADDTSAFIQAALAASGKTLRVPKPAAHYKLTSKVRVYGSVVGVGMPEIRMYGASGQDRHSMLEVIDYTGPGLVISGLRLNGGWDGVSANGEWSHNILTKGSKNITIENNILERPYGDNVLLGGENNPRPSENVIIRNNQMSGPRRCNIALISTRNTVIRQNVFSKSNDYVSAIDLEPNPTPYDSVWGTEISGNQFTVPRAVAVLLYHFDYGYPADGLAGGDVTITGNTGSAMRFFAQVGNWSGVTQSGNF